jgi:hypothetical protein
VGMHHKAYTFDWTRFQCELQTLLVRALTVDGAPELEAFIDQHRELLTDPYEGEPLPENWRASLGNRDVHAYGDIALTLYYDPADDRGIGGEWIELSNKLSAPAAKALLGFPIGSPAQLFDPGRYGSYFQTPELVGGSLEVLRPLNLTELQSFVELFQRCQASGLGVYVTF